MVECQKKIKKKKLNYVETVHFSFCMKTAIKLY